MDVITAKINKYYAYDDSFNTDIKGLKITRVKANMNNLLYRIARKIRVKDIRILSDIAGMLETITGYVFNMVL
ncbi:MAG: hypothetical protein U5N56_00780 [Candidatus Marinimicrobia bacterium]|nr:hypothetical protein [Candidatus Neomarinimicrobiota bacterium]